MQNYELIPYLGEKQDDFWDQSNVQTNKNNMDRILSYMKVIIDIADSKGLELTRDTFHKMGNSVELFNGVDTWFDRINAYSKEKHINIEHYVISAGLKEIIEGTPIADKFTDIFACSYIYDKDNKPTWPRQVVNYTTKTQYISRISKGCLDLSDDISVNKHMEEHEKRVPLRNFIYIGDSDTDIPAMRLVKQEQGYSIGVYNPKEINKQKVYNLINDDRINSFAPADYSLDSKLERIVRTAISKIKFENKLRKLTLKQQKQVLKMENEKIV